MAFGEYTPGQTESLAVRDGASGAVSVTTWESRSTGIVTVTSGGLLTAVAPGTALVVAKDGSGNVLASEIIRVKATLAANQYAVRSITPPVVGIAWTFYPSSGSGFTSSNAGATLNTTVGGNSGNAHAPAHTGDVTFSVVPSGGLVFIGLSTDPNISNAGNAEYGLGFNQPSSWSWAYVDGYHGGVQNAGWAGTYTPDVNQYSLCRTGDTVTVKKDGVVVNTYALSASGLTLYPVVTIYNAGRAINNIVIS